MKSLKRFAKWYFNQWTKTASMMPTGMIPRQIKT